MLDFSEPVPQLLDLYVQDRNQNRRIMALAARRAILIEDDYGRLEERAVRRLYEVMEEERSGVVHRLTRAVLPDYAEAREE